MPDTNYPKSVAAAFPPDRSSAASEINRDGFFTTPQGLPTVVTGGDLHAAIPPEEQDELVEIERYWAAYPYSYVSICRSEEHNEIRYFVVEPYLSEVETQLIQFVMDKLEHSLRNESQALITDEGYVKRADVRKRVLGIIKQYDICETTAIEKEHAKTGDPLFEDTSDTIISKLVSYVSRSSTSAGQGFGTEFTYEGPDATAYNATVQDGYLPVTHHVAGHPAYPETEDGQFMPASPSDDGDSDGDDATDDQDSAETEADSDGVSTESAPEGDSEAVADGGVDTASSSSELETDSPEAPPTSASGLTAADVKQAALDGNDDTVVTEYHLYKLLYYIERELLGYGQIDAIKNDQSVEDISCNGYDEPVFVFHTRYEQIRTNVIHQKEELDQFVKSLAQFAGKEVSRRSPEVDAKIPDGSRAQLTLGEEVSEDGTNYTIRQFKDIPFTPIDLINWKTYSVGQLARLWLAVEHGMSILVAGGTGAGKTTTLNALSLFIPARNKIVSIEDTQEIKLPHRNWTRKTTREAGDQMEESAAITEFDLLKSALRMRPDRIIMGEVRGEEGQDLLQGMSTGHSGITTFHADSIEKVIYRFTTDPIAVDKALFTSLDMVCIQTQTQVDGDRVRRTTQISEIGDLDTETNTINHSELYTRDSAFDTQQRLGDSQTLTQIKEREGWQEGRLEKEIKMREAVLAYLSLNEITAYKDVAAVIQAFIQDRIRVMKLVAADELEAEIPTFRELGNIELDSTKPVEQQVDRPRPPAEVEEQMEQTIIEAVDMVISDE